MPPQVQRVGFHAQAGSGLRWRLDGADLGPAERDVSWPPAAGRHRLVLADGGGNSVAEVRFAVRGAPLQAASTE